ncbi:MAG: hypothetical protein INR66_07320 [Gordonia polyisoprenivorans]|jgi:hypothetical protein|nr:hypothetical protein [Gordonia polyisoprenivorans]
MSTVIAADRFSQIDPTAGLSSTAFGWTLIAIFLLGTGVIGAGISYAIGGPNGAGRWRVARVVQLLAAAGFFVGSFALVCWLGDVRLPMSVTTVAVVAAAEFIAVVGFNVWDARVRLRAAHEQER